MDLLTGSSGYVASSVRLRRPDCFRHPLRFAFSGESSQGLAGCS